MSLSPPPFHHNNTQAGTHTHPRHLALRGAPVEKEHEVAQVQPGLGQHPPAESLGGRRLPLGLLPLGGELRLGRLLALRLPREDLAAGGGAAEAGLGLAEGLLLWVEFWGLVTHACFGGWIKAKRDAYREVVVPGELLPLLDGLDGEDGQAIGAVHLFVSCSVGVLRRTIDWSKTHTIKLAHTSTRTSHFCREQLGSQEWFTKRASFP